MMRDTMASTQALCVPMEEKEWPTLVRKCEYHVGVPGAIPVIALEIDVCVLLTGKHEEHCGQDPIPAPYDQGRHHSAEALRRRGGGNARDLIAGIDSLSMPVLTRGHAIRARAPYMNTDPGAPVSAEAVPVKIIPRPSPKSQTLSDHTIEMARAGRTVRRYEEPGADDQLDRGEEDVPYRNVRRYEVTSRRDEPCKGCRLPAGIGGNEGRDEVLAEHVRLVLQGGVEYPEKTEDDLEGALGPDG